MYVLPKVAASPDFTMVFWNGCTTTRNKDAVITEAVYTVEGRVVATYCGSFSTAKQLPTGGGIPCFGDRGQ